MLVANCRPSCWNIIQPLFGKIRTSASKCGPKTLRLSCGLMKKILRWFIAVAAFLLILCVAALLLKNPILKWFTEKRIEAETGMDAEIGEFQLSFRSGSLRLSDFKVQNAPEFGESALLHIPKCDLIVDSQGAAGGKLRFKEVHFALAEFNVVRSKTGELNIDAFQKEQRPKTRSKEKKSSDLEFGGIDKLYLTLGKLRFTDLKDPRQNAEYDLAVQNELIENIKTEEELQARIMTILIRVLVQDLMNPTNKPLTGWLDNMLNMLAR